MPSMGLRMNSGSRPIVDASLGDTLAKAIWGDMDSEVKLARLRDDMATSEYNRRQIQSAIDFNKARTDTANWELGARRDMVGPLGEIIEGGMKVSQPVAQPAPVVVAPTPAPAPAPAPATPAPVVVEPTPAPAAAAAPSIIRLPDDQQPALVAEPDMPAALQPPSDAESQFVTSPDAAYLLAQRGEGWDAISGAEGNLPIIIEEGSPSEQSVASITNMPDTPTEEPAQPTAAAQPVPVAAATAPASVASAPAPAVPADLDPHPASAEPQSPDKPAADLELPATAPVPAAKPGAPNDASPQSNDKVVLPTNTGPLVIDRQEAEALAAGLIAGGGDVSGQAGKLAGQIAIINDPTLTPAQKAAMLYTGSIPSRESILGTDEAIRFKQATDKTDPTKLKENLQIIKDRPYQVGQDKAGHITLTPIQGFGSDLAEMEDLVPDLPGDGENVTMHNYVQEIAERKRRGLPISPSQASVYAAAYDSLYGEKITTANGVTTEIPAQTPENLPTPADIGAPAAAPAPATPAPAEPAPAEPAPAPAPAPATPAQAPAKATNPNAVRVSRVNGREVKNYGGWVGEGEAWPEVTTAHTSSGGRKVIERRSSQPKGDKEVSATASRDFRLAMQAIPAMKQLDDAGLSGIPTPLQNILEKMSVDGGSYTTEDFANLFTDPETRMYAAAVATFVNSQARPDTGAAVRAEEYADYARRFSLRAGASKEEYKQRRKDRNVAIKALRASLIGQIPEAQLQKFDEELAAYGRDLDWNPDAPAGGGDTSGEPDFIFDPKTGQSVPNPAKAR